MNKKQREKEIQLFGEQVVLEHLKKLKYACDFLKGNHPCFDIDARKNEQNFLVSVKARNDTKSTGEEKTDTYGLFHRPNAVEQANKIARAYKATQMWATVRINTRDKVYDAYYGFVDDLNNKKQIPMNAAARRGHAKFGENIPDKRIKAEWSNVNKEKDQRGGKETHSSILKENHSMPKQEESDEAMATVVAAILTLATGDRRPE